MVFEAPPVPLATDAHGTIRVAGTRIRLDTVVYAYQQGYTAEEIVSQFPVLNLADVYGVITYYLNNKAEVTHYLETQANEADELRESIESQPGNQEFRKRIQERREAYLAHMKMIQFRHYTLNDYQRVDDFLILHHQPDNQDGNWIQPAWEYMHGHPSLDHSVLDKIGIWEDVGKIVAIAHYEGRLGEAFFELHPEYKHLKADLLDYAEKNLYGHSQKDGRKFIAIFINDNDKDLQDLASLRGYERKPDHDRPMAQFVIPDPFPPIDLPEGYALKSLADECDWAKVNRVLWRGFNHEGEPPMSDEELTSRQKMFDTPTARRDLKIAAVAPNGEFASFCGMFYEPVNHFAYVEPVATDPSYRRLGLGKAAVLEGIRRCGALGAKVAYVGSDQAFYLSFGFRLLYTSECWVKDLDEGNF